MAASDSGHRRRRARPWNVVLAALGCALAPATATTVEVTDRALETGFQDIWFGTHQRGRAMVVADFDLDGRPDFYVGNPSDRSFVVRNLAGAGGQPEMSTPVVLLDGVLAWGAAASDYDNDGDYDLFVAVGGNEGIGYDRLFRNMWVESNGQVFAFRDDTETAGLRGPVDPGSGQTLQTASGGAVWVDYDNDGDTDLFVNGNIHADSPAQLRGRNTLWRNDGDGTFSDVTAEAGLAGSMRATRHSTFFDMDNDGDQDLYESNYLERNVLWRNRLAETGTAGFEDVTAAYSMPGEDLGYPWSTFASTASDLDNDGWLDLVVFMRDPGPGPGSPYADGHALFRNHGGVGFANIAGASGLNVSFPAGLGVMGCQVGDVDGDGTPDLYVGTGGPPGGNFDQLYLSDNVDLAAPHWADMSHLVDFPAAESPALQSAYPPYPYRTHGIAFVDATRDGTLEIAVANGGPSSWPDSVREPNRLFDLNLTPTPGHVVVRPRGDGVAVSRDAIGARVALTVRTGDDPSRTLHRVLLGSDGFSAHNGFEIHFYTGDADTVDELAIVWPDGAREALTDGLAIGAAVDVSRADGAGSIGDTLRVAAAPGGGVQLDWDPSCVAGADYAVYRGTLGEFLDHAPLQCGTAGATTASAPASPADEYFLVVPRTDAREGAYGIGAAGARRVPSPAACAPQQIGVCGD